MDKHPTPNRTFNLKTVSWCPALAHFVLHRLVDCSWGKNVSELHKTDASGV